MGILRPTITSMGESSISFAGAQHNKFVYVSDSGASETAVALGATGVAGCRTVRAEVSASAALASGESYAVAVKYLNSAGTATTLFTITLDDTTTAAGATELADIVLSAPVAAGTVLWADVTYTAGGGPADPTIALVIQLTE